MKIRPVGAELFHAGGRPDMTKLMLAFRSFANAHKRNTNANVWNTENVEDGIKTMEELKEALKKARNGKSSGERNLNSELHTYAGDSFHERLLFYF
jgi:hypothetical protein